VELSHVLAFDIGGSHATAGIVNFESLTLSCVKSCTIDSNGTADTILDELFTLGDDVVSEVSQLFSAPFGIAVAVPGPFNYEHGISLLRHKYASLYGMDLLREIQERFGVRRDRIVFLNDAKAFLLGESHAGAAKDVDRCIGLTLGTGIGSAFSIGGDILEEGTGVPPGGEIYCLPWEGRTVEDAISTRAIQELYRLLSGESKTVRDICTTTANDRLGALVMHEFGNNLGLVLRDICRAFHPDAVVLGGAISRSAELFLANARVSLGSSSDQLLRVSMLFDDAPLIGSAVWCLKTLSVQA
jgi:glucokinase